MPLSWSILLHGYKYWPIIGLELRFGQPNMARQWFWWFPVLLNSLSASQPWVGSYVEGVPLTKYIIWDKIADHVRQSMTEGVFQSHFLWVALLCLQWAPWLFGSILPLQVAGDEVVEQPVIFKWTGHFVKLCKKDEFLNHVIMMVSNHATPNSRLCTFWWTNCLFSTVWWVLDNELSRWSSTSVPTKCCSKRN